jgi:uncharacterized protein YlxW (UPF0749 family)
VARRPPTHWQAAIALFLVTVGFLVVAQLRSRQPIRQALDLPTWRLQELAVLVRQQEAAREQLVAEVEALRRQAGEYEAALTEGRSLSEAMAKEVAQFRLVLGLVPVKGPGVRVVVTEGADTQAGVLPPEVQAQDVAGLVNELWSAGAEAMAINGLRVLATTGMRQVASRVVIAGMSLSPPYRIEAIGDPAALKAALAIRGGFVDGLRSVGLKVEVKGPVPLRLPARPAAETFRNARPRVTQ